jgi:hypothetical protein
MTTWTPPTWDRTARRVGRARIAVPPGAPRHRLAHMMEEALRLAVLPGENEGRVYYFRQVRVRQLPASGDRATWLRAFQDSLTEQASEAIHAADPRSSSAGAVYFQNQTEALEVLLLRLLENRRADEWFWQMAASRHTAPDNLAEVVEALRDSPASWRAVAGVVFALPALDPVRLLHAIPAHRASAWVTELDRTPAAALPADTGFAFDEPARARLVPAVRAFGVGDPRVAWLAALAVELACPGDAVAGNAVHRARIALRRMAHGRSLEDFQTRRPPAAPESEMPPAPKAVRHTAAKPSPEDRPQDLCDMCELPAPAEATQTAAWREPQSAIASADSSPTAVASGTTASSEPNAPAEASSAPEALAAPANQPIGLAHPIPVTGPGQPAPPEYLGAPTSAGGLFFLLNACQGLELPAALESGLSWACPDFVPRLLLRLAEDASIPEHDPVLEWLRSLVLEPPDPTPAPRPDAWWPVNLTPSRRAVSFDCLVRSWAVAVRRWCWRAGGIAARDIVTRDARFSVNRTDLDVSLPLDTADLRIRRMGLDLDPGWLPWFGRVVRFHYSSWRDRRG